jgi:hypothetical protein
MKPNIDPITGIHFGVIPPHETQWYEAAKPFYPAACPHCGSWELEEQEENPSLLFCESCHAVIPEGDQFPLEPTQFVYEEEGYFLSQSADDHDIFVCKAPYYTLTQPCSACAPNAGYLPQASLKGSLRAFCLGHDFFESGQAPYPVFLVETGEEVKPTP